MSTVIGNGHPVTTKTVHPGNAYLVRVALERYSAATNTFQPWSGTAASAFFALDAAGTQPITGLTSIAMTESAGAAGVYTAEVASAAMNNLTAYVGQTVYQIVRAGPSLTDARVVTPLVVRSPRYAQ